MSKTVYLHIGLPKTGSSTIQHAFYQRRDRLSEVGIRYLQTGALEFNDFGHHILLMGAMGERGLRIDEGKSIEAALTLWESALLEIESCSEGHVLVSSELFSLDLDTTEAFEFVRDKLASFEVKIVIVLRDVVDFVNSVYAQRVRDGYDDDLHQYIVNIWPSLNWKKLIDRWGQYFGSDSIVVLKFENLIEGSLANNFCREVFGLTLDQDFFPQNRSNFSLPHSAILFLKDLNRSSIPDEAKFALRDILQATCAVENTGMKKPDFLSLEASQMLRLNCEWPEPS